ncbi:MAG: hypothetical protein RPU64_10285 [Candidatus Sedimenticola sp. (ex Thyasira tokunagai)]
MIFSYRWKCNREPKSELYQALRELDMEKIASAVEKITACDRLLCEVLTGQVNGFRLHYLLNPFG